MGQRGRVQSLHRGHKLVPDIAPDPPLAVREGGCTSVIFFSHKDE